MSLGSVAETQLKYRGKLLVCEIRPYLYSELAIHEALEGKYLPLDLIVEHTQCVSGLAIRRLLGILEKANAIRLAFSSAVVSK